MNRNTPQESGDTSPPQQVRKENIVVQFRKLIIGRPLATREAPHQTLNKPVGLAIFASDNLSSVAYATEEILRILAVAGVAAFTISIPIALAIGILLFILTVSYRKIIFAYPNGGGAYVVARDNLGEHMAQVAAASLLTDYILTVSVSIAAGVAQVTSVLPFLLPWRVHIAVAVILFMTIMNLRGVKESGRIFALPTYFFVGMMFLMLGAGFLQLFTGSLQAVHQQYQAPPTLFEPLTLFLVLRAFSSGCTALTGLEALSNGITAFREPKSRNAAITMTWMSAILGTMFIGITILAVYTHAMPLDQETVISQLARTIFGTGILHVFTLGATFAILFLAANTAFAGFPRLAALQAGDGFLPRHLAYQGSRLVFTYGIVALGLIAAFLLVIFEANVTLLIPLYAIGVFLSFTLSQIGMVVRARKVGRLKKDETVVTRGSVLTHDPGWRVKQFIMALGACASGIVLIIFAATKFFYGAWIVIFLIPLLTFIFFGIHHHYRSVADQLSLQNPVPPLPKEKTVVILVSGVHQGTLKAVEFVRLLNPTHLKAVHVATDPAVAELVARKWQQWVPDISLDIVESPYRDLINPIITYIENVDRQWPNDVVVIAIPEFIPTKPWHHFLHSQTAKYVRDQLEHREDVVILDVPYRLHDRQSAFSFRSLVHAVQNIFSYAKNIFVWIAHRSRHDDDSQE